MKRVLILFLIFIENIFVFGQDDDLGEYERYLALIAVRQGNEYKLIDENTYEGDPIIKLLGTGFFIYDDIFGTDAYYLVTNYHIVAENSLLKYFKTFEIFLKLYPLGSDGPFIFHTIALTQEDHRKRFFNRELTLIDSTDFTWRSDTSNFSDAVVIKVSENIFKRNNHYALAYPLSESISLEEIKIGKKIFTMGFPGTISEFKAGDDFTDNFSALHSAVFRFGNISSKPLFLNCEFWKRHYVLTENFFINELFIFPGQSGSPVFLQSDDGEIYLTGIVSAYFYNENKLINTGLSIGWSIDVVKKIISDNKEYFKNL